MTKFAFFYLFISTVILIWLVLIILSHTSYWENLENFNFKGKILFFIASFFGLVSFSFTRYFYHILLFFYVIISCFRVLYNIDFTVEYLDDYVFFMEGEGSGKKYPDSNWSEKPKLSAGSKRGADNLNSNVNTIFIRDNGAQIFSRDPKDWGWNIQHDFSNVYSTRSHHCQQMANLLEYHNKVHGRVLVSTCYDVNPFLSHSATEFFDLMTKPLNIPDAPMSDKLANNLELRNLFRSESYKPSNHSNFYK